MYKVEIKTPIWWNKSLGVHIPDKLIGDVEVSCTYTTKAGIRLYPDSWIVDASFIRTFPTQIIRKMKIHIIPIEQLKLNSK